MMRSPAPRSLPELTRWTLLSSTLIDWLRLPSTNSSTKSAPDLSARLITLSTSDWSSNGMRPILIPSPSGGGQGGGLLDERDHPDRQQPEHDGRCDEDGGVTEARRNRRAEQRPDGIADRGAAAGQAIGGSA